MQNKVLAKEDVLDGVFQSIDYLQKAKNEVAQYFGCSPEKAEIKNYHPISFDHIFRDLEQNVIPALQRVEKEIEGFIKRQQIDLDNFDDSRSEVQESKEILSLAEQFGLWGTEELAQAIGPQGLSPSMSLTRVQKDCILSLCQKELDSQPRNPFVPDLAHKYLKGAERW